MRRTILALLFCLVFSISALAATITVSSHTFSPSTSYPGTTCTLRIYSSITFTTSDGQTVMAGTPGTGAFFKSVPCSIASGVITIPSFTIPSTTDAIDNQNARYTAVFYDSKNVKRDTFFADFPIPTTLGLTVTWAGLRVYKAGVQPIRDTSTYSKFQTDTQIQLAAQGLIHETPSGLINSSNQTFILARTPLLDSEFVYRNGVLQTRGNLGAGTTSYTISGSTITHNLPPQTGDRIVVDYRTSSGLVNNGTVPMQFQEGGGPTVLTIGSVADGKFLKRSGTTIIGVDAPGGSVTATPDTLVMRDSNGGGAFSGITVTSPVDANLFNAERFTGHVNIGSPNSTSADYKLNVIHSSIATSNASQSGYGIIARMDMQTPSGTSAINAKGVYGTVWTTGAATYSGQISAVAGNAYMLAGSGPVGSTTTGPGDNGFISGLYGRVRNESASDMWLGYGIVSDGPYAVGAGHIKKYVGLKIIGPYTGQVDLSYGIIQSGGGYNQFSGAVSIGFDTNSLTPLSADPLAALDVQGGVGGTSDIQRWRFPTGETIIRVSQDGALSLGATNSAPVIGQLTVFSGGTTSITAVLKAIGGQSADLLQLRNSADTIVFSVGSTGNFNVWDGTTIKVMGIGANDSCGAGFRCLRIAN